ncbi:TPA: hypothetical protein U1W61_001645 [Streptococcus suis]|nr:hypothetical protein [Streptococcus suis]NQI70259.1 hypothetical protein [Streptococcus suis]HEM4129913.1 hypothetical protein [Streptococcus suis]
MKNKTLFTKWNTFLMILYYISYVLVLLAFLEWEGRKIVFITLVLFGIPLIAFFLPFVGGVMFYTKKWIILCLSYLLASPAVYYLQVALADGLPLRGWPDFTGDTHALPLYITYHVIGSIILFLVVATISFLFNVARLWHERRENSIKE